jgi:hypothetical protein
MNFKTLVFTGLAAGALLLTGCADADSAESSLLVRDTVPIEVVLGSDPARFDFGTISMREGNVYQTYLLKNGSGELRTITNIVTSCMCTDATIDGQTFGMHGGTATAITLADGEKKELLVRFDSLAHGPDATGPITRDIYITTDHPSYPETRIQFTGNVIK